MSHATMSDSIIGASAVVRAGIWIKSLLAKTNSSVPLQSVLRPASEGKRSKFRVP